MKLKILKGVDTVRIELDTSSREKPMVFDIPVAQVDAFVALIQQAKNADYFIFSIEI